MTRRKQLLWLTLFALGSCSKKGDTAIFLNGICAPSTSSSTTCSFEATCGAYDIDPQEWVYALTIDPITGNVMQNTLYLPMEIDNELPNNADVEMGRPNTNDADIDAYILSFSGSVAPLTFTYPTSAVVDAAGTTVAVVPVVPSDVMSVLATEMTAGSVTTAEVNVNVVATGHLVDGTSFTTSGYPVAVQIRQGEDPLTPTCSSAGDVMYLCPGNWGQSDQSQYCTTPP